MGIWINGRPAQEYLREQAARAAKRETTNSSGTFGDRAMVLLDLPGGRLAVTSHSGDRDWRLHAIHNPGEAPLLTNDSGSLRVTGHPARAKGIEVRSDNGGSSSVSSISGAGVVDGLTIDAGVGGQEFELDLPMLVPLELVIHLNDGRGNVMAVGLNLETLRAVVGDGDLACDLSGAALGRLDLRVKDGDLEVILPVQDGLSLEAVVGDGDLTLKVPESLGLRLDLKISDGDKHGFGKLGLLATRPGHWESPAADNIAAWCAMVVKVADGDLHLKRV